MILVDTAAIVAQIAEERAAAQELIEKGHHLSEPLANAFDRCEKAAHALVNAPNEIYASSHRSTVVVEKYRIENYSARIAANEGITR